MKKEKMKKIGLFTLGLLVAISTFSIGSLSLAGEQEEKSSSTSESEVKIDGFTIIPEIEDTGKIEKAYQALSGAQGHLMEEYSKQAEKLTPEEQLASGIMNRDTIVNYLGYIIKFLSQLGLVVGAGFIIYAGYKYMVSIFNGGKVPSQSIKNAIIGIIIVIFSYAIMKTLTSIVGLS